VKERIKRLTDRLLRPAPKTGKRPPIFVYVGYLLVATVIFTGVTFSGYISSTMGNDQARVAKFDVKETGVQELFIDAEAMLPGDQFSTPINITNSSEVAVELTINATLMHGNLPLVLSINNTSAVDYTYTLAPNSTMTEFPLVVEWPKEENDPAWAGMTDMIRVVVSAVQKD